MKRKDHVVIPNSILSRFRGKETKISVLDLNTFCISEKATDKIFVEKNYYSEEIDKFIRDNVETEIGKIYTKVKNGKELSEDDYKNMELIFLIQFFRNNEYSNRINNETIIGLIGNKMNNKKVFHNIIIGDIIRYLMTGKCCDENIERLFKVLRTVYSLFKPGVLVLQNTSRSLILPASQFTYISFPSRSENYYIFPVAPSVAFVWKEVGLDKDAERFVLNVNDDKIVENINKAIIEGEIKVNVDNCVFGEKNEIERMQKFF